ncbi:MAG TPA: hypothetical protein DCX41_05150 [Aequorivita sp.]|nr:hypothetical protein [Pusillimonas sp.]HAV54305.1 hypothetical protein [Aequorivita sp.]|tara:strand:- start:10074 stop:11327 length:1254 start_codon:yes stop_codon:yes gene_type:complete
MDIRVISKKEFLNILKKGKGKNKLLDALYGYNGFSLKLPSDFPRTALANDLANEVIREEILTGIVYLMLSDNKSDPKHNFIYSVEDLQKVFSHLDKKDLLRLGQDKLAKYNEIITTLTTGNKKFEGIFLDSNWTVSGNKTSSIENYEIGLKINRNRIFRKSKDILNSPKWFYIIGFSFFFIPFVAWPVAVLGLYKTNISKEFNGKKLRKNIVFVSMLILNIATIYIGYYYFDQNFYLSLKEKPLGEFYPALPKSNMSRFAYFNKIEGAYDKQLPNIKPGESTSIFMRAFYGNKGKGIIYNANLKYYFDHMGQTSRAEFVIFLKGSNTNSIFNELVLYNFPEQWRIEAVCARVTQEDSPCDGYNTFYDRAILKNTTPAILMGDLDTVIYKKDGKFYKCDYGFVEIEFIVTNTKNIENK